MNIWTQCLDKIFVKAFHLDKNHHVFRSCDVRLIRDIFIVNVSILYTYIDEIMIQYVFRIQSYAELFYF